MWCCVRQKKRFTSAVRRHACKTNASQLQQRDGWLTEVTLTSVRREHCDLLAQKRKHLHRLHIPSTALLMIIGKTSKSV